MMGQHVHLGLIRSGQPRTRTGQPGTHRPLITLHSGGIGSFVLGAIGAARKPRPNDQRLVLYVAQPGQTFPQTVALLRAEPLDLVTGRECEKAPRVSCRHGTPVAPGRVYVARLDHPPAAHAARFKCPRRDHRADPLLSDARSDCGFACRYVHEHNYSDIAIDVSLGAPRPAPRAPPGRTVAGSVEPGASSGPSGADPGGAPEARSTASISSSTARRDPSHAGAPPP